MAPISIHSVHFSFWYQKEWWKITFHISSKWLWFRSFVLPFCLISITKSVFKKLKRDNYSILSLCMFEKLFDKRGKTAKIRNADNGFISCSGACKLWALCPPLPSICERCVPPPCSVGHGGPAAGALRVNAQLRARHRIPVRSEILFIHQPPTLPKPVIKFIY